MRAGGCGDHRPQASLVAAIVVTGCAVTSRRPSTGGAPQVSAGSLGPFVQSSGREDCTDCSTPVREEGATHQKEQFDTRMICLVVVYHFVPN